MKLWKFNKKQKTKKKLSTKAIQQMFVDETHFLQIVLPDDMKNSHKELIMGCVEKVSNGVAEDSKQNLATTFPYATFKSAESLFTMIKNKIMSDKVILELKFFTWEQEKKNKSIEVFNIERFPINYDYRNMIKKVYESLVNDDESGLDSDTLIAIITEFTEAYRKSTGVAVNEIPPIPTEEDLSEAEENYYVAKYPSSEVKQPENKKEEIEPEKESNTEPGSKQEEKVEEKHEEIVKNTRPVGRVAERVIDVKKIKSRSTYQSILENFQDKIIQQSEQLSNVEIQPQQFDLSGVEPAAPYEANYVHYMLDQKKKIFNKKLQAYADKLNNNAFYKLTRFQKSNREIFSKKLLEVQNLHEVPVKEVKEKVREKVKVELHDEKKLLTTKAKSTYDNRVNEIKKEAEAKMASAKSTYDNELMSIDNSLADKYSKVEADRAREELMAHQEQEHEAVIAELKPQTEKMLLNIQDDIAQIKTTNMDAIARVYKILSDSLPEYEAQIQTVYLNAVETHAVEQRAQEIGRQNKKINEMNDKLIKQNQDLVAEKVEINTEIKNIQKTIDLTQKMLQEQSKNNDVNNETKQELIKKMDQLKTDLLEKQKKSKKIGKEIATVGVIAGLLVGSGVTYAATAGHNGSNQTKTERTTAKIAKSAKSTKSSAKDKESSASGSKMSKPKNSSNTTSSTNTGSRSNNTSSSGSSNSNSTVGLAAKNLMKSMPDQAQKEINNGNWKTAITKYADYANEIEDQAFKTDNISALKTINQNSNTEFGVLDQAILSGDYNMIIASYETSSVYKSNLQESVRVNAIGKAYLSRNHYNSTQNDYLSAVDVWSNNKSQGEELFNDLQRFVIDQKLQTE